MRVRLLLIAAVAISMLGGSFGGCFGGPACNGLPGQRAVGRDDPQITHIDMHSTVATWDFADPSAYKKNMVDVSPGKANLSREWNISGESWSQLAALSGGAEREDFSAAYDDINNQMIIHGGYYWTSGMQNANYYQNLYTYDPCLNSWTDRGAAKLPHGNVGVWDRADRCFITHGGALFDMFGDVYYAQTWAWYPANTTWVRLADGPTRFFHSAAWDIVDGVMLVFGGQDTNQGNLYNDLWAYKYSTNSWTKLNPPGGGPGARIDHTAVWDNQSKQMLVFGGFAAGNTLSDVWAYNYTQNSWTQKASATAGRASHAACWNSHIGVMTVFGGRAGASNSNETLNFDPGTNSWLASSSMPAAPRIESSAVYDPVRQQMMVYGGGTGSGADEFTETWSFKYGQPVLKYAPGGTVQSPVLDLGEDFHKIDSIGWYGELPAGSNVTIRFRASDGNVNLSGFQATANGSVPVQQGRHMQWNISLMPSADRMASPSVALVKVEYTQNSKPNVTAGQPMQAPKRKTAALACNATDADGDALSYNWTRVSGPVVELNATDVPCPVFTPLQSGTYLFAIVVSDGYSSSPPVAMTVVVSNRPPVADAGPGIVGNKNELVTLHGAGTDADGDPLSYDWTQTGGPDANLTQTAKSFLSFLPQKVGNYTFRLVVNDGEQDSDPSFSTVSISARPPEAVLSANASLVYLNNNVDFSAERSSDPDGILVRYLFDFGDGTDSGWIDSSTVTHAYLQPGVFNASLNVRDDDGLLSGASAAVRMTVRNRPPVVKGTVTPLEGNTSTLFRFSVPSGSTFDPDGLIAGYIWDFGDGTSAATSATSHTYKKKGEYEIVFRVTDEFGDSSEAYFSVNVLNRGPELLSSAPAPASYMVLGNEQLFTVTALDPDGDLLDYQWSVDGARQSVNGSTLILAPQKTGQHRINLTVSDGELSVSADWTITVKGRPAAATQQAGPDIFIAVGVIIVIAAIAGAVLFVRRGEKRDAKARPSAQYSPSTPFDPSAQYPPSAQHPSSAQQPPSAPTAPSSQYPPSAPSEDIPMALPIQEARQSQYGAGPMEAIPVNENAPMEGPQDQMPQESWKPVQEPYSKQLWNK